MTRRERMERRLERRREWAESRDRKAAERFSQADPYRGDVAFNTQPGHIPERARVIRATEKGVEHYTMARHHESKAAGLEHQLERSVFSDDPDAIEALEARIAELEAKRDRMKLVNTLWKKRDTAGLAELGIDLEQLVTELQAKGPYWGERPHLTYELTNIGGRIRDARKRIETIRARQETAERAEAVGGVLVEPFGDWCRVTFAEKPERAVLDELKAAGFRWGGGSWGGPLAALPEGLANPTRIE